MNAPTIQAQPQSEFGHIEDREVQPLSLEEIALIGGGTAVVNTI